MFYFCGRYLAKAAVYRDTAQQRVCTPQYIKIPMYPPWPRFILLKAQTQRKGAVIIEVWDLLSSHFVRSRVDDDCVTGVGNAGLLLSSSYVVSADEAVRGTGNAAPLVQMNAFLKWLNHSPLKPTHSNQLSGSTVINVNESCKEC
jgi:hypothetical protein